MLRAAAFGRFAPRMPTNLHHTLRVHKRKQRADIFFNILLVCAGQGQHLSLLEASGLNSRVGSTFVVS